MNREKARFNMVEQQIHPWYVHDTQILNLMATIPRELFVPSKYRSLAFSDMCIPLEHDQKMFKPREEARILQSLNIQPHESLLEIGTGTGFMTALCAHLAKTVYSIDIFPEFITFSQQKLKQLQLLNVILEVADASQNFNHNAPYDVILIGAALPMPPSYYLKQLTANGRLFCVQGSGHVMQAMLYEKQLHDEMISTPLFEMQTTPLIHAQQPEAFIF